METIKYIAGDSSSRIIIGEDWKKTKDRIDTEKSFIITDTNIKKIYGADFPPCPVISISPGEDLKSMATVEKLIEHLLSMGADRSSFLLGIGGGVICDITGFVASVYMRGIAFGFVSTSLLSQVDASIGGKNGVNVDRVKNIAGCFNHPSFVVCDPSMLNTLTEEEYLSGLGELIKHALIKDIDLLGSIEDNLEAIKRRDNLIMEKLIAESIRIKVSVISQDEKEKGERRLLNFGHTIGHAIESSTGLKHGISVAHGMNLAAEISHEEGMLDKGEIQRSRDILLGLGLLPEFTILKGKLAEYIYKDKKKEGDVLFFVKLEGIGNGKVKKIPVESLLRILADKGY